LLLEIENAIVHREFGSPAFSKDYLLAPARTMLLGKFLRNVVVLEINDQGSMLLFVGIALLCA